MPRGCYAFWVQTFRQMLMAVAVLSLLVACGDSTPKADMDGSTCLDELSLDCQPLWPNYDAIYDNLLIKRCGSPDTGSACHTASGAQAGLVLSDREGAYEALLGTNGDLARVIPGDPECSVLIQRLLDPDPTRRMPIGSKLEDNELCSVIRWVAEGAKR